MPFHAMTPHISGTSLSAQTRYAAGVREILECFFNKKPIRTYVTSAAKCACRCR
jgi:formate dehydrogenase